MNFIPDSGIVKPPPARYRHPPPTPFGDWLAAQVDRPDGLGVLAQEALDDPPPKWTPRALLLHMRSRRACDQAMQLAKTAIWIFENIEECFQ